jgi:hypothetical protein
MTAMIPSQECQRRLHINDGNNAIVTRVVMPAPCTMNNSRVFFSLGQIGFLSKTALSQPSQQGKEGLDKGDCTDSSVMPNNCVRRWAGWVEVASPPETERERATLAIFVWPQT